MSGPPSDPESFEPWSGKMVSLRSSNTEGVWKSMLDGVFFLSFDNLPAGLGDTETGGGDDEAKFEFCCDMLTTDAGMAMGADEEVEEPSRALGEPEPSRPESEIFNPRPLEPFLPVVALSANGCSFVSSGVDAKS